MKKLLLWNAIGIIGGGGLPAISVDPATWDFGSTPVGTPVTKEFTIENTGTATLLITLPITIVGAEASAFTVTVQPAVTSLAPGASTTFTVQADADAVDVFDANISIISNVAGSPTLIPVSVDVVAIPSRAYFLGFSDYYVDSINGNNANNGTSPSTPKQTISGLPAIAANSVVGLACGSTWTEQLNLAANGIRVGAYVPPQTSATAQPIFDCSGIVTTWLDSTDRGDANTNVYSKQISTNHTGTNGFINVYENGINLTYRTSLALCQANAGSYFVSSNTVNNPIIYIHPVGSTDPDTNGREYRVTQRQFAVNGTGFSNLIVFDLECRKNLHEGGSVKVGRDSIVHSCTLLDGNSHSVFAEQGSAIENCTITDAYHSSSPTLIVFYENAPAGGNCAVIDCIISRTTYAGNTILGMYAHTGGSGGFGALSVSGCTFNNLGQSIGSTDCFTSITMTDNNAVGCQNLLLVVGNIPVSLSGNTYLSNYPAEQLNVVAAQSGTTPDIVMVNEDYTIARPQFGAIALFDSNQSLSMTGCRVEVTSTGVPVAVQFGKTGCELTINTTNLISAAGAQLIIDLGTTTVYAGNNNTFCAVGDADNFAANYHQVGYTTLAAWRTATGQDANSVVSC